MVDLERLKYLYTGLGQYSYFLGNELSKLESPSLKLTYLLPEKCRVLFEDVSFEKVSLRRKYFPYFCPSYDLWHSTHQDSDYLGRAKKFILTVHDLNFLEEKSPEKSRKRLKSIQRKVDRADALTAISNFTAETMARNLDLKGKKVNVIYNGIAVRDVVGVRPPKLKDTVLQNSFIFWLGVIKPKKNVRVLISMLEKLKGVQLVIAGGEKESIYYDQIIEDIKKYNLSGRVHVLDEVGGDEKVWLYQNCQAFAFPSLLEGFGLPVIEAMSFGKPVFISNKTCLPEIGGPEAYIWKSFDPQEMASVYEEGISNYQSDVEKKTRLINYAHSFSWKKAAREYCELYQKVLQG